MEEKHSSFHSQNRIQIWIAVFSLLVICAISYYAFLTNIKLKWLESQLAEPLSTLAQLNWQIISDSNNKIADIDGINSVTLPNNMYFARTGEKGSESYQTLTIRDFPPGVHDSVQYLVGSTIGISSVKMYDNLDQYWQEVRKMYEPNEYTKLISYEEFTLDGYRSYKAVGEVADPKVLGMQYIKPSQVIVIGTYVDGRAIEFSHKSGRYFNERKSEQAQKVFNEILSSVSFSK